MAVIEQPMAQLHRRRRRLPGWTWRETQGFLFVLPWLIGFVLFIAGPFLFSFIVSLTDWSFIGDAKWLGLRHYARLLSAEDQRFVQAVYNTT